MPYLPMQISIFSSSMLVVLPLRSLFCGIAFRQVGNAVNGKAESTTGLPVFSNGIYATFVAPFLAGSNRLSGFLAVQVSTTEVVALVLECWRFMLVSALLSKLLFPSMAEIYAGIGRLDECD